MMDMPERIWAGYESKVGGYSVAEWSENKEPNCYTEYLLAAPVTAELDKLRGLLREAREGFDRIIGMCDAPSRCTCGRPNGLPAVVACALSHSDAITAEVDGEPTIPVPLTDLRRIQSDLSLQTAKAMDREPEPTALEKQMREALEDAEMYLISLPSYYRESIAWGAAHWVTEAALTAYRQRYGEEAPDA